MQETRIQRRRFLQTAAAGMRALCSADPVSSGRRTPDCSASINRFTAPCSTTAMAARPPTGW